MLQVPGVRAKIGLPQGTRFGPLVGEPLQRHEVSPTAIKKYFWRVSTEYRVPSTEYRVPSTE